MRKIVAILLCAVLLLGTGPAVSAEEAAVPIGSREDMLKIAADPAGSYELTDDIDMGGEDWTPIPFSGTLNGNGHALYNLVVRAPGPDIVTTYDGNHKEYETVFGGLFSALSHTNRSFTPYTPVSAPNAGGWALPPQVPPAAARAWQAPPAPVPPLQDPSAVPPSVPGPYQSDPGQVPPVAEQPGQVPRESPVPRRNRADRWKEDWSE